MKLKVKNKSVHYFRHYTFNTIQVAPLATLASLVLPLIAASDSAVCPN